MRHGRQNPTVGVLHRRGKDPLGQRRIAWGLQIRRGKPQCSAPALARGDAAGKTPASAFPFHLRLAQNAHRPQRPLLPLGEANQGFRRVKNRADRTRPSRVFDWLAMGEIDQLAFV